MTAHSDAIVIGGGLNGLVAATYLAKAGRKVLLLEAEETLGGTCHATSAIPGVRASFGGELLAAFDPRLVKDLGLRGLKFAVRDMPLVALRQDGRHLILSRDAHATSRVLAAQSRADADAYRRLRTEIFALARTMRPFWWENSASAPLDAQYSRLKATSAASLLSAFESDTLKAALAFDTVAPFESGSALALVWRAAQEMCGLQGAVAVPQGGLPALIDMLTAAAQNAGVEIRTKALVARLIADNAVAGVALDTGEEIFSHAVLSSLPRRKTLLDLAPTASAGFAETQRLNRSAPLTGEASILFLLNAAPDFDAPNARYIIADRLEVYAAVESAAREHRMPDEIIIEAVVPTAVDPLLAPPGQHLLSVRVPGLPLAPHGGWPALPAALIKRVTAALAHHIPHLRERMIGIDIRLPTEEEPFSAERLVSSYSTRVTTPIEGLFLCGTGAEPMNAVSGRAGRLAAGIAQAWLAREKRA
jgi:phytoene dehydrogenase-like protein